VYFGDSKTENTGKVVYETPAAQDFAVLDNDDMQLPF
jgi:hypothetical protein